MRADKQRSLTAIIKTFERPEVAQRLIDSIRLRYQYLPVLVADDSENPTTYQNAHTIQLPHDVGLSAGRNQLLEAVETEYFLLLDDDQVFNQETELDLWLSTLQENGYDILACFIREFRKVYAAFYGTYELVDVSNLLMHREKHHANENGILRCDFIPNCFIANTQKVRDAKGWVEQLKLEEHWEFFYRTHKDMKIGYFPKVSIDHRRESNPRFDSFRKNQEQIDEYRRIGKALHSIESLTFTLKGEAFYSF